MFLSMFNPINYSFQMRQHLVLRRLSLIFCRRKCIEIAHYFKCHKKQFKIIQRTSLKCSPFHICWFMVSAQLCILVLFLFFALLVVSKVFLYIEARLSLRFLVDHMINKHRNILWLDHELDLLWLLIIFWLLRKFLSSGI